MQTGPTWGDREHLLEETRSAQSQRASPRRQRRWGKAAWAQGIASAKAQGITEWGALAAVGHRAVARAGWDEARGPSVGRGRVVHAEEPGPCCRSDGQTHSSWGRETNSLNSPSGPSP